MKRSPASGHSAFNFFDDNQVKYYLASRIELLDSLLEIKLPIQEKIHSLRVDQEAIRMMTQFMVIFLFEEEILTADETVIDKFLLSFFQHAITLDDTQSLLSLRTALVSAYQLNKLSSNLLCQLATLGAKSASLCLNYLARMRKENLLNEKNFDRIFTKLCDKTFISHFSSVAQFLDNIHGISPEFQYKLVNEYWPYMIFSDYFSNFENFGLLDKIFIQLAEYNELDEKNIEKIFNGLKLSCETEDTTPNTDKMKFALTQYHDAIANLNFFDIDSDKLSVLNSSPPLVHILLNIGFRIATISALSIDIIKNLSGSALMKEYVFGPYDENKEDAVPMLALCDAALYNATTIFRKYESLSNEYLVFLFSFSSFDGLKNYSELLVYLDETGILNKSTSNNILSFLNNSECFSALYMVYTLIMKTLDGTKYDNGQYLLNWLRKLLLTPCANLRTLQLLEKKFTELSEKNTLTCERIHAVLCTIHNLLRDPHTTNSRQRTPSPPPRRPDIFCEAPQQRPRKRKRSTSSATQPVSVSLSRDESPSY